MPAGIYVLEEYDDSIVVGFTFMHFNADAPLFLKYKDTTYCRELLECVPNNMASTLCSCRRYVKSCN
jgi:hypothetical protein